MPKIENEKPKTDTPGNAKLVLIQPSRIAGKIQPAGTLVAEIRISAGTWADIDKAIATGRARVAL